MEQRALDRGGDDGTVHAGRAGRGGEALLGGAGDGVRVGADAGDGVAGGRLVDEHPQHVERVEFALSALECELSGALEHVLRARAEEAAEVDRTLGASALACEVAGEELVERAVVLAGRGEVFGHSGSPGT